MNIIFLFSYHDIAYISFERLRFEMLYCEFLGPTSKYLLMQCVSLIAVTTEPPAMDTSNWGLYKHSRRNEYKYRNYKNTYTNIILNSRFYIRTTFN